MRHADVEPLVQQPHGPALEATRVLPENEESEIGQLAGVSDRGLLEPDSPTFTIRTPPPSITAPPARRSPRAAILQAVETQVENEERLLGAPSAPERRTLEVLLKDLLIQLEPAGSSNL